MSRVSYGESTEPFKCRWSFPRPAKVIGQASDADWKRFVVLAKPVAKLLDGADKIEKLF